MADTGLRCAPQAPGSDPRLDDSIESLRCAAAYPKDGAAAEGIDWIQTHISHVFLSRTRVYFRARFRSPVANRCRRRNP
jgi:hypothetical protein